VSKIKEKWCVVNVFYILVNVTFKVGLVQQIIANTAHIVGLTHHKRAFLGV
jgi:hypothetical protein